MGAFPFLQRAVATGAPDIECSENLNSLLKSRGIHTIDQLLVTHADTDHMGDIEVVAKAIRIKEILTSQGSLSQPSFVRRLRGLKCHVRVLAAGDQLPIMGSVLQVLYPWQLGDGKITILWYFMAGS